MHPRVSNVDGHRAYASAIDELKRSGELGRRCRCRPSPYLNNIVEQDHRFVKKRVAASQGFRSVEGAPNTIAGYEAWKLSGRVRSAGYPKATSSANSNSLNACLASRPDSRTPNATPLNLTVTPSARLRHIHRGS
jgi:hypothetical protein